MSSCINYRFDDVFISIYTGSGDTHRFRIVRLPVGIACRQSSPPPSIIITGSTKNLTHGKFHYQPASVPALNLFASSLTQFALFVSSLLFLVYPNLIRFFN
jgi:hypothetical protein